MTALKEKLIQRFFRYVTVPTQSDAKTTKIPSTSGQRKLAELLAEELQTLGLKDVHIDENSVLTAFRPGNRPDVPKIGFLGHLDTMDIGLSAQVKPQLLRFTGNDICLNREKYIWLKVDEHPEIRPYKDQEIIFSDGTSVLGADNKAAVAIIMQLLSDLNETAARVGDIYMTFVPDAELGMLGSKMLDVKRFPVDFAYTIGGCGQGEVVYETFNAASAQIRITGITAHPMSGKDVMVNPFVVAGDLMSCFDRKDTPEHTEGRQGYFWLTDMIANASEASLTMAIRDFDLDKFAARKNFIHEAIALTKARHPKVNIDCEIKDVYENINNVLKGKSHQSIDLIFQAFSELGIEPRVNAMRGGTDGSVLSARGVITPNYFNGGLNFHSRFEFLPVESFIKSYNVTRKICELVAQ